ncbi:MAG: hypothetical protein JSV99_00510 [Planctomycetota bacterium]|nr:MAG: hypothetical protein JSV99_00510 [Planctomycetota bacterium]
MLGNITFTAIIIFSLLLVSCFELLWQVRVADLPSMMNLRDAANYLTV